jgi:integrase
MKWKIRQQGKYQRVDFRVSRTTLPNQTLRFPLDTPRREIYKAVEKRIEALRAQFQISGGDNRSGFSGDALAYLQLPQILKLATFPERKMQIETLAAHFGACNRHTITKRELETVLGKWQAERHWEPGTFNKWLTAIKSLYAELEDPEGRSPNPARKIRYQDEPDPMPRAIDYAMIVRVLERLKPADHSRNRIAFSAEHNARAWAAEGRSNTQIAARLGVSETAIRKLLARPPMSGAREAERARLALRVMAFTGLRQGQIQKLRPEHWDRPQTRVWVTQSGKGDRSFWKPLDPQGVAALDAFAAAEAWGKFDTHNARRIWRAAWKAESLTNPPRPYDLRHSYLTEAYLACSSLSALKTLSGHAGTRTLERYTKAAEDAIARQAANALGERLAAQLNGDAAAVAMNPQAATSTTDTAPSGDLSANRVGNREKLPKPLLAHSPKACRFSGLGLVGASGFEPLTPAV